MGAPVVVAQLVHLLVPELVLPDVVADVPLVVPEDVLVNLLVKYVVVPLVDVTLLVVDAHLVVADIVKDVLLVVHPDVNHIAHLALLVRPQDEFY